MNAGRIRRVVFPAALLMAGFILVGVFAAPKAHAHDERFHRGTSPFSRYGYRSIHRYEPALARMPRVRGMPLRRAKRILRRGGFSVLVEWVHRRDVPAGVVVRQRPRAGRLLSYGRRVRLIVSAGRHVLHRRAFRDAVPFGYRTPPVAEQPLPPRRGGEGRGRRDGRRDGGRRDRR